MEILEKYHEGIIALSACLAGEVARAMVRNQYEMGKEAALRYEKIFGKGNFFLELQDHGISEQRMVNQQLMRLSAETGIELVATNDITTRTQKMRIPMIFFCACRPERRSRMRTACATRADSIS